MRLKRSICRIPVIVILVLLVFLGPVSAADTWIQVDRQDQIIAWETLNAHANMANLFPYAPAGSGSGLLVPGLKVWKNLIDSQPAPVAPLQPSVQPAPALGDKTIGGTPVSELFKNAMNNYRANPPKPPVVPWNNVPIYSHQMPINWL
jgi:hypothetical protein